VCAREQVLVGRHHQCSSSLGVMHEQRGPCANISTRTQEGGGGGPDQPWLSLEASMLGRTFQGVLAAAATVHQQWPGAVSTAQLGGPQGRRLAAVWGVRCAWQQQGMPFKGGNVQSCCCARFFETGTSSLLLQLGLCGVVCAALHSIGQAQLVVPVLRNMFLASREPFKPNPASCQRVLCKRSRQRTTSVGSIV
jgi:hypothetical protein